MILWRKELTEKLKLNKAAPAVLGLFTNVAKEVAWLVPPSINLGRSVLFFTLGIFQYKL